MTTIKELIYDINEGISLINQGDQTTDNTTSTVTLKLINRVIASYNLQSFLSFNNQTITLTKVDNRYVISTNPVSVERVYYLCSQTNIALREVSPKDIALYHTPATQTPSFFSYQRGLIEDDAMFGEITLDVDNSQYQLYAVIANEISKYGLNDTIVMPDEYLELILTDVQLRLLSDLDASESLINRKAGELERIKENIKRVNFKPIGFASSQMRPYDLFLSGRGRL
jgi:hypothetical protein